MISSSNAVSAYANALPSVAPDSETLPQGLTRAASDFARVMEGVDTASTAAMTGKGETADLVHAITQAEFAMETVVAIRDKVVEAYQEILRMPV